MNVKFEAIDLQNKAYKKFAKKNRLPVGHQNDPGRRNLNIENAGMLLKRMKK